MRIVSWNCNGALRNKLERLESLDADIFVVQECEDPLRSGDANYQQWSANSLWVGSNKNRGLGVFAKPDILLEQVPLDSNGLQLFLPCRINSDLSLLAIWTKEADSPTFKYIGQLWKFLQAHEQFLTGPKSALIGDLNSNACWDVWDRWWNHSDVVKQLSNIDIYSLYHHQNNELQGQESQPTLFHQRNPEKPYHIDYVFLSESLLPAAALKIGTAERWLEHSDHMPLIIDIAL